MKIYVKGKDFATFQVDETWVETEDEIVETPIGAQLKSFLETDEYKQKIANIKLAEEIMLLKKSLQKYKEDVEQNVLFGMNRSDYEEKKEMCQNIVLCLRKLENEQKNQQK